MTDDTTTAREAVRPAVACATWSDTGARDHVCTPDDSFAERPAVAIDGTAADIRERVRAAVFVALYERLVLNGFSDGQAAGVCVAVSESATRALGVQP